ncbi:MAG: GNAT family N-acetyltransferase [Novosphingobium sp.]
MSKALSAPDIAALFAQGRTPFDRAEWFAGLERDCGLQPMVAVARGPQGLAVLPLQQGSGQVTGLANWYSFHLRPLSSPDADADALLAAIARDLARMAWRVTLAPLPDEDGSASLLEQAFRSAGWLVRREICDTNHIFEVSGQDYSDYLASRPGQLRTTLKRKSSRFEVGIYQQFTNDTWETYEAIYAQSWKPDEGFPRFIQNFARAEAGAGRLRLGIASADGQPVAVQMWTVENGTAYIHKLAYVESARPHSPGSVLSAAMFREVIDIDRVSQIDFGTGDDPYKRDWMGIQRPRFRLDMFRPQSPQAWPHLGKAVLRRLAGMAQRR